MKPLSVRMAVFAMGLAAHLSAQSVEFIGVEKLIDYKQTGNGEVSLRPYNVGSPPFSAPYQFRIDVEGENLSGISAPTFTIPGGSYASAADGDDHGKLFFNAGNDEWSRTFYFPGKYSATGGPPSMEGEGGLDGLFHNGTYSVTVNEVTYEMTLGGDANADIYPNAPVATVSAGTWAGGGVNTLYVDVSQALTITTNTFADFTANGHVNHIGLFIDGGMSGSLLELESFSDSDFAEGGSTSDFLSYTLNPYSLTSGQTYFVEIEFNVVAGLDDHDDDILAAALFTTRTQFVIQAVPEPSTYAAIVGVVALAGVIAVRRRRVAAA